MFVSGIENLPCELQRNFQLMRELDQRTEGVCGSSRAAERRGGGDTLPLGTRLSHACARCLRCTDKKAEIDRLAAEYIESVKSMSAEQRVEHLRRIQSAYSKCKEYSDDKVQLAMQTYEMVSAGAVPLL